MMQKVKIILKQIGITYLYWRIRNTISLLDEYRRSLFLYLAEMFSALSYKWKEPADKAYLAVRIRKRSHQVEKIIMLPQLYQQRKKETDYLAKELESFIDDWLKHYKEEKFVTHAQKISREYKELFLNSKQCLMIGKTKRPGEKRFEEILKSRRSTRLFLPDELSKEDLDKLIEAAKWAPASCNCQALKFILVRQPDLKKAVSRSMTQGGIFTYLAPVILVVLSDKRAYRFPDDRFIPYQDAAAAIQNILLEAEYLGLGACWCAYTSYSNIRNELGIRRLLGIPKHMVICGAIAIGKPAQDVCVPPRPENNQIYSVDHF